MGVSWESKAVPVQLTLLLLESARMVPVGPVWKAFQLWPPFPILSSSGSHLRYPGGSLQLWEALPVAVRQRGLASHPRAPPSFLQNRPGSELPFRP